MASDPVTPTPAATLILVRPRGRVPEVLLLKRGASARFMPNAYVFAGGAVDAADAAGEAYGLCAPLDDADASRRLGVPAGGLQHYIAAIRESFEECGLLLAYDGGGQIVDLSMEPPLELERLRVALSAGETDLAALCRARGWRLAADQLSFYSHWITPPTLKRRFDTRFFIARAPTRQQASLAGTEMSDLIWRTAAEALAEHDHGEVLLVTATRAILAEIAGFEDIDALFESASSERTILPTQLELPAGSTLPGG
jgi:8-oxo-dGTP pyrophosphatase MutT (NUDIX family)